MHAMAKKMDTLYSSLAEYFVFDKQKYSLEEFMSDIKKFKDQFKVSLFFTKFIKIHKFTKIVKFTSFNKIQKIREIDEFQ